MYIGRKMFIYLTLLIAFIIVSDSKPQSGQLDETFGNKGIATTAIIPDRSNSEAFATKIQGDGKIVAGGFYFNGNDFDFAVIRYNKDGSLDNSFGTNGIVITPVSRGADEINSILIQIDSAEGNIEKIIAAGFSQNSRDTDFVLVRYNPNGSLDSTFGGDGNGIVKSGTSNYADFATSITQQRDGKLVVAGYQSNGHDFDFMVARLSADGIPDNNFGNPDGIITTEISGKGTDDLAYAVAIQNNGDLIVAGSSDQENSFAVARYKSSGLLDPSFADNGIAITSVGSPGAQRNNIALSAAIQEDGKIVIGGRSLNDNINDFTLLRYKSNGEPDSTFNDNGIVITDLQNNSGIGSIFIDHSDRENEKIIAAGSYFNGFDIDVAVARYDTGGKLDDSFGTGGIVIIAEARSNQTAFAADYETDPLNQKITKIITAGYFYDGASIYFSLAALNDEGIIDNSFGTNGIVKTPVINTHSVLNVIAVQPEGGVEKIIAAGYTEEGANPVITMVRYNPDGKPDSSFGKNGDGIVITPTTKPESIRALLVQNDGKIIAVGLAALVRYNQDGIIDTLFGSKGFIILPVSSMDQSNNSAAIQDDGKIVIAGGFFNDNDFDFAVVRYDSEGNLDTKFGSRGDGIAVTPIGTSDDFANSIAVQKDGKIVVAGDYRNIANKLDLAVIRYDSNGIPDNSFGTNGIVVNSIGTADDFAYSVAIQSDGKIITAGASGVSDYNFSLVRYNEDGSIDRAFGSNGVVTTSIGNEDDIAVSLTLQKDRKIIVLGNTQEGTIENFALVRYDPDGNPDPAFGTNGVIKTQIGSSTSSASSLLLQGDGKIIAGGSSRSTIADYSVFTLIRYTDNLATAVDDNNSGKSLTSFTLEQNYPNPFNPTTKIKYTIPYTSAGNGQFNNSGQAALSVQLKVYDILGNEVATLVNKEQQPGNYEISFNAGRLSSGVYFYRLNTGNLHMVKKMILMK